MNQHLIERSNFSESDLKAIDSLLGKFFDEELPEVWHGEESVGIEGSWDFLYNPHLDRFRLRMNFCLTDYNTDEEKIVNTTCNDFAQLRTYLKMVLFVVQMVVECKEEGRFENFEEPIADIFSFFLIHAD